MHGHPSCGVMTSSTDESRIVNVAWDQIDSRKRDLESLDESSET